MQEQTTCMYYLCMCFQDPVHFTFKVKKKYATAIHGDLSNDPNVLVLVFKFYN